VGSDSLDTPQENAHTLQDRGGDVNWKKKKTVNLQKVGIAFIFVKSYTEIMKGRPRSKNSSGQATVEYLVVFIALLLIVSVFALSLYAVRQQAGRTLDLVGSDYP